MKISDVIKNFFGITKIYWTRVDRKRVLMVIRHARTSTDYDRHIARQRKILARHPGSAAAHLYLGNMFYAKGEVDAARNEWEKVLTLDDARWANLASLSLEQKFPQ